MTPVQQATPSAISHNSSENQGLGLGHRKGMVITSFNVNSLLLHIDEIRTLVKDLGIHILSINELSMKQNLMKIFTMILPVLRAIRLEDVIATAMVVG